MKLKNIKTLKAGLIGLVFIGTAIFLLAKGITTDYTIIFGLLITGTGLLFVPNKVINRLERIVIGKEIKLFKDEERE